MQSIVIFVYVDDIFLLVCLQISIAA